MCLRNKIIRSQADFSTDPNKNNCIQKVFFATMEENNCLQIPFVSNQIKLYLRTAKLRSDKCLLKQFIVFLFRLGSHCIGQVLTFSLNIKTDKNLEMDFI